MLFMNCMFVILSVTLLNVFAVVAINTVDLDSMLIKKSNRSIDILMFDFRWEIILCNTCGSQGRHAACLPDADDSAWICQDCTIIKDPNAPPPTLNIPCTSTQDDSRKRKIECVDENEEIDVIELSDSDDDPGVMMN